MRNSTCKLLFSSKICKSPFCYLHFIHCPHLYYQVSVFGNSASQFSYTAEVRFLCHRSVSGPNDKHQWEEKAVKQWLLSYCVQYQDGQKRRKPNYSSVDLSEVEWEDKDDFVRETCPCQRLLHLNPRRRRSAPFTAALFLHTVKL